MHQTTVRSLKNPYAINDIVVWVLRMYGEEVLHWLMVKREIKWYLMNLGYACSLVVRYLMYPNLKLYDMRERVGEDITVCSFIH